MMITNAGGFESKKYLSKNSKKVSFRDKLTSSSRKRPKEELERLNLKS